MMHSDDCQHDDAVYTLQVTGLPDEGTTNYDASKRVAFTLFRLEGKIENASIHNLTNTSLSLYMISGDNRERLYGDDSFFVQFMTEDQKNSKRNSEGRGRKPRNYLTDPSDVVTTIINQEGTFLFEFAILKVSGEHGYYFGIQAESTRIAPWRSRYPVLVTTYRNSPAYRKSNSGGRKVCCSCSSLGKRRTKDAASTPSYYFNGIAYQYPPTRRSPFAASEHNMEPPPGYTEQRENHHRRTTHRERHYSESDSEDYMSEDERAVTIKRMKTNDQAPVYSPADGSTIQLHDTELLFFNQGVQGLLNLKSVKLPSPNGSADTTRHRTYYRIRSEPFATELFKVV